GRGRQCAGSWTVLSDATGEGQPAGGGVATLTDATAGVGAGRGVRQNRTSSNRAEKANPHAAIVRGTRTRSALTSVSEPRVWGGAFSAIQTPATSARRYPHPARIKAVGTA